MEDSGPRMFPGRGGTDFSGVSLNQRRCIELIRFKNNFDSIKTELFGGKIPTYI